MSRGHNQALRDLFKGASIVYVGLVVEIGIAFLAQLIAARYLSLSGFGGVTTGAALVNLGSILGTLGLSQGLTRYFPRLTEAEKRTLLRIAYAVVVPVSLALSVAIVLNAETIASGVFGDGSVAVSIRIFGAAIPFSAVMTLSVGGIRGQERSAYRVVVKNFLHPLSRLVLVIAATAYGLDQAGYAMAYAVPYAIAGVAGTVLLVKTLPGVLGGAPTGTDARKLTREVLDYSLPFTVTSASGYIYRNADIFLLLYFLDSSAVGVYGVAYAAARLILMFSTAMNFLGTPVASELEKEGGWADSVSMYESTLRWLLLASVPALMPLVVFPAEFISELYRPEYAAGALALTILACGFAVHNVFTSFGSVLRAGGKSRPLAFNSILGAALNIGLNLYLIPRYGVTGAAIATFAAYGFMDFLRLFELKYYAGTTPLSRRQLPPILLGLPSFGAVWFVRDSIPAGFHWLVVTTILFGLAYWCLVVVVAGLEPEDVMLVESAVEKYDLSIGLLEPLIDRFEK